MTFNIKKIISSIIISSVFAQTIPIPALACDDHDNPLHAARRQSPTVVSNAQPSQSGQSQRRSETYILVSEDEDDDSSSSLSDSSYEDSIDLSSSEEGRKVAARPRRKSSSEITAEGQGMSPVLRSFEKMIVLEMGRKIYESNKDKISKPEILKLIAHKLEKKGIHRLTKTIYNQYWKTIASPKGNSQDLYQKMFPQSLIAADVEVKSALLRIAKHLNKGKSKNELYEIEKEQRDKIDELISQAIAANLLTYLGRSKGGSNGQKTSTPLAKSGYQKFVTLYESGINDVKALMRALAKDGFKLKSRTVQKYVGRYHERKSQTFDAEDRSSDTENHEDNTVVSSTSERGHVPLNFEQLLAYHTSTQQDLQKQREPLPSAPLPNSDASNATSLAVPASNLWAPFGSIYLTSDQTLPPVSELYSINNPLGQLLVDSNYGDLTTPAERQPSPVAALNPETSIVVDDSQFLDSGHHVELLPYSLVPGLKWQDEVDKSDFQKADVSLHVQDPSLFTHDQNIVTVWKDSKNQRFYEYQVPTNDHLCGAFGLVGHDKFTRQSIVERLLLHANDETARRLMATEILSAMLKGELPQKMQQNKRVINWLERFKKHANNKSRIDALQNKIMSEITLNKSFYEYYTRHYIGKPFNELIYEGSQEGGSLDVLAYIFETELCIYQIRQNILQLVHHYIPPFITGRRVDLVHTIADTSLRGMSEYQSVLNHYNLLVSQNNLDNDEHFDAGFSSCESESDGEAEQEAPQELPTINGDYNEDEAFDNAVEASLIDHFEHNEYSQEKEGDIAAPHEKGKEKITEIVLDEEENYREEANQLSSDDTPKGYKLCIDYAKKAVKNDEMVELLKEEHGITENIDKIYKWLQRAYKKKEISKKEYQATQRKSPQGVTMGKVVSYIKKGKNAAEIAEMLNLSPEEVITHKNNAIKNGTLKQKEWDKVDRYKQRKRLIDKKVAYLAKLMEENPHVSNQELQGKLKDKFGTTISDRVFSDYKRKAKNTMKVSDSIKITPERAQVLKFFEAGKELKTTQEIAKALGKNITTINGHLRDAVNKGQITKEQFEACNGKIIKSNERLKAKNLTIALTKQGKLSKEIQQILLNDHGIVRSESAIDSYRTEARKNNEFTKEQEKLAFRSPNPGETRAKVVELIKGQQLTIKQIMGKLGLLSRKTVEDHAEKAISLNELTQEQYDAIKLHRPYQKSTSSVPANAPTAEPNGKGLTKGLNKETGKRKADSACSQQDASVKKRKTNPTPNDAVSDKEQHLLTAEQDLEAKKLFIEGYSFQEIADHIELQAPVIKAYLKKKFEDNEITTEQMKTALANKQKRAEVLKTKESLQSKTTAVKRKAQEPQPQRPTAAKKSKSKKLTRNLTETQKEVLKTQIIELYNDQQNYWSQRQIAKKCNTNQKFVENTIHDYQLLNHLKPRQAPARGAEPKMTKAIVLELQAVMGKPGTNVSELARRWGVSLATIYRYVAPDGTIRDWGKKLLAEKK